MSFCKDSDWITSDHEILHTNHTTQREAQILIIALSIISNGHLHISPTLSSSLLIEQIHFCRFFIHLLESIIWIEEFRINIRRSFVILLINSVLHSNKTHNKNLSRFISRSSWFGCLHLLKQLIENVYQRMIISRTEHLRHKNATFSQEFNSQTKRMKNQRVLSITNTH